MKTMKYLMLGMALLLSLGSCTTKFDEYNTNPNEMDLWNIGPSGMLQQLLYSGTEVFLYRTWLLNGELIQ